MSSTLLEFDFTHCAGRFDQPEGIFDTQLDVMMAISDGVGVTEVDKNSRARHLQTPGWNAIYGDKGPRDDCGLTVRRKKFKVLHEETHTCSSARYKNERGWMTDTTEAAFQVVEDRETGAVVVLGEIHAPHGMGPELRKNKIRSDVARAYVKITRAYLKRANQLMKKFKTKLAVLGGDWNLNFRLRWVRLWFRKNFRGWKINWAYLAEPKDGTHGRSIIDGLLLCGLKPNRRKMLGEMKGNDHQGFSEHLVAI